MNFNKAFTNELQHEAANTKKMLARVPFDQADWKPHAKSSTLINLAKHVARTPQWISTILTRDDIDVTNSGFGPYPEIHSAEELTAYHDSIIAQSQKDLDAASDEEFQKPFSMRAGDKVMFTLPKAAMIRNMALNHTTHHRGQLSVYLRLLDVPVPGMFGPSADDKLGM